MATGLKHGAMTAFAVAVRRAQQQGKTNANDFDSPVFRHSQQILLLNPWTKLISARADPNHWLERSHPRCGSM